MVKIYVSGGRATEGIPCGYSLFLKSKKLLIASKSAL